MQIINHINGYSAIVSEKNNYIISSLNNKIIIYTLDTKEYVKEFMHNGNINSFCMDNSEQFLFYITTEAIIGKYSLKELKHVNSFKIENDKKMDHLEDVEFYKICCIDERYLFAISLNNKIIVKIDTFLKKIKVIHNREKMNCAGDVICCIYDNKKNIFIQLVNLYKKNLNGRSYFVERNYLTYETIRSENIYAGIETTKCVADCIIQEFRKGIVKRYYILKIVNVKNNAEYSIHLKDFELKNLIQVEFINEQNEWVLLYENGFLILKQEDSILVVKKCESGFRYMHYLNLYNNSKKAIIIGWEYSLDIDIDM